MSGFNGKKCSLITMMLLTISFMFIEIVIGHVTNSMALIADSFHMLSDIVALIIAYLSVLISPKQWKKNTFGWARAEVLGALVNAVFLVALCFSIIIEACKRFISVEPIREPIWIVFTGVLGLVVNVFGLFLFRDHTSSGHSHSHGGISRIHTRLTQLVSFEAITNGSDDNNENRDRFNVINNHSENVSSAGQMNIRGVYLHILADACGSLIAIVSALIVWLTDWKFRDYTDAVLSLLLVIVILYSTWPLFYESALILLQTPPTHIEVNTLREKLLEIDGVLDVHEFHVWQLTGDRIIATAHIRCKNLHEYMTIAVKIKEFFHNEGIHSTTIQSEFVGIETTTEDCVLNCPKIDDVISCKLQTCCGSSKQSLHVPPKEDNQCDNTTSVTIDANSSQSQLSRDGIGNV